MFVCVKLLLKTNTPKPLGNSQERIILYWLGNKDLSQFIGWLQKEAHSLGFAIMYYIPSSPGNWVSSVTPVEIQIKSINLC